MVFEIEIAQLVGYGCLILIAILAYGLWKKKKAASPKATRTPRT